MTAESLSPDTIQKIKHDLRGPAVNVRGYVGEIGCAIDELVALVEHHKENLPEEFKRDVAEIVAEDLTPCLKYLNQASKQFHKRIDDAATLMSGQYPKLIIADS
ncbi:MAG: hypothetical protein AB8G18_00640 [Gammaproteobacteria bacterium]